MSIGHQLLNVPFGQMISSLGRAIADAQRSLDENSIHILEEMGRDQTVSLPFVTVHYNDSEGGLVVSDDPIKTSMIGAGFQPTFYQFAETIIEVKIAITMSYEYSNTYNRKYESGTNTGSNYSVDGNNYDYDYKRTVTTATTVDAGYSNKYNYNTEGSSLLRTRLVPVPPNSLISQMIEIRSRAMEKVFDLKMKDCEQEIEEASQDYEDAYLDEKEKEQNKAEDQEQTGKTETTDKTAKNGKTGKNDTTDKNDTTE